MVVGELRLGDLLLDLRLVHRQIHRRAPELVHLLHNLLQERFVCVCIFCASTKERTLHTLNKARTLHSGDIMKKTFNFKIHNEANFWLLFTNIISVGTSQPLLAVDGRTAWQKRSFGRAVPWKKFKIYDFQRRDYLNLILA